MSPEEHNEIKNIILKFFEDSPYDLIIEYEITSHLVKHGIDKKKAMEIFFEIVFSSIGIKCLYLPPEYIRNFDERIKKTLYYDEWINKPVKKRLVVTVCHLVIPPRGSERRNLNHVLIVFKDGTKITLGSYRRMILEAFEYFKRLKLTDYVLLGFFWKIKGYNFEKSVILSNSTGELLDMIEPTQLLITEEIINNMKKLGVYDIWRKDAEYFGENALAPGIFLRFEYFDEEKNWINYNAIKRKFRITL